MVWTNVWFVHRANLFLLLLVNDVINLYYINLLVLAFI